MQKTKLGISVGLFGAAVYFMGLFSGYLVAVLLTGYVLLREEKEWLRKSAVKVLAVMALFSPMTTVINFVPSIMTFINCIVAAFGGNFYISLIANLVEAIVCALNIIEKLLLLALGVTALNQGTVAVPVVDNLINKFM